MAPADRRHAADAGGRRTARVQPSRCRSRHGGIEAVNAVELRRTNKEHHRDSFREGQAVARGTPRSR